MIENLEDAPWFSCICGGLKLFGDGLLLVEKWRDTLAGEDGTISMVLCEWLLEHREEILARGSAKDDFDIVVDYLSSRIHDPLHNRTDLDGKATRLSAHPIEELES